MKNSMPLFSIVEGHDSNLTISFQGTVLAEVAEVLSKSYIWILSGGYTNKILKLQN